MGRSDHVVKCIAHFTGNDLIVVEEILRLETELDIGQIPGVYCEGKVRIDNPPLNKSGVTQQDEVIGGLEAGKIGKLSEGGGNRPSIDDSNGRCVTLVVKIREAIVKSLKESIRNASFPIQLFKIRIGEI